MNIENLAIGKDFFDELELVEVNMESFKGRDIIGFEIQELVGGFRIFTKRIEENPQPAYYTTIFNGPEPKNIIVQKKTSDFIEAIRLHYSALNYLNHLKEENN